MRLLAQKILLDWLADTWRLRLALTQDPERSVTLEAMRKKLRSGTEEYSELTAPWLDAASSDLHSGLFQEAYEELSSSVLQKVQAGLTAAEEAAFRSIVSNSPPTAN